MARLSQREKRINVRVLKLVSKGISEAEARDQATRQLNEEQKREKHRRRSAKKAVASKKLLAERKQRESRKRSIPQRPKGSVTIISTPFGGQRKT